MCGATSRDALQLGEPVVGIEVMTFLSFVDARLLARVFELQLHELHQVVPVSTTAGVGGVGGGVAAPAAEGDPTSVATRQVATNNALARLILILISTPFRCAFGAAHQRSHCSGRPRKPFCGR